MLIHVDMWGPCGNQSNIFSMLLQPIVDVVNIYKVFPRTLALVMSRER